MNKVRDMFGLYTVPRVRDGSWGEIDSNLAHAERNIKLSMLLIIVNVAITLVLKL